jgi:hypothetical protein
MGISFAFVCTPLAYRRMVGTAFFLAFDGCHNASTGLSSPCEASSDDSSLGRTKVCYVESLYQYDNTRTISRFEVPRTGSVQRTCTLVQGAKHDLLLGLLRIARE